MFSSVLPGVSTNMKFMHNPPSKPSNRYINPSTNPNVTYIANPNLYDLGYVSILPSDGIPPNWYPNSSYSPPYGQDYAIYSNPAPNPFDYDQSTPFLDFEDASSITTDLTASPALSTDSLEVLKSPVDDESPVDELDPLQSQNRAIHTSLQPITIRDMPRALHPPFPADLVHDGRSTISELEVEERDRIAKINAEYNATSHAAFYINNSIPSQAPMYPADRFREARTPLQIAPAQMRPCPPLTTSQPRHPDLNFPPRPIGSEKRDLPSPLYQIYANPVSSDLSPPSVERLPSQLQSEQNMNANKGLVQSSPPAGSRSYEGTPDSDRSKIVQNRTSSPTGSIPQIGHSGSAGVSPQHYSYALRVEKSPTAAPSSVVPAEITRKRRPSVMIASSASDPQDTLQYRQQSRSDTAALVQPSTTANNQSSPHNASPELRQDADAINSSPHAQIIRVTEPESTERLSLGSSLRRDTKTPAPLGRYHSYIRSNLGSPSGSSQDVHSDLDTRDQEVHRSSPKRFVDDKSGHVDHGQSPSDARVSPSVPLREHSASISRSNSPLSREAVRHTADADRESERSRRSRSSGSERAATTSIYAQGPLHLSPEGALATFPQPEAQGASAIIVSEPRAIDPHHSKASHDQASTPNSRESHKIHENQYVNVTKSPSENTKHEADDARTLFRASPVNKFASTFSSPLSKSAPDSHPMMAHPEPHRRHSDGEQSAPPIRPPLSGRNSAPLVRSVRWTENLIAPSPILGPPRRRGWFNRRGDQLWTNHGDYRPPRTGDDYPLDLDDYPEPGDGWMNEDGVRIDMSHRRIPKALPRPVLKKL